MQLFYSGALSNLGSQTDPLKSLGGMISISPIPNGLVNAVFPAISRSNVKNNDTETRLIVLQNTTGSPVTNILIYTARGTYSTLKIAAVAPAYNTKCSRFQFEAIVNGQALPYQATLASCEGQVNAIVVPSLDADEYIGIWIERVLDMSTFNELDGKQGSTPLTDDELVALLTAQDSSTQYEEEQLLIDFTVS